MKLRTKILFLFLGISLLPVLLTGYFAYRISKRSLESEVAATLEALNIEKSQRIFTWIDGIQRDLEYLAGLPVVQEATVEMYGNHGRGMFVVSPEVRQFSERYLQPLVNNGKVKEVFFLCPFDGVVRLSTDPNQEGKVKSSNRYFLEGRKHSHVEEIFYSMTIMQPSMVIALPIRKGDGTLLGVLAARLNLDILSQIIAGGLNQPEHHDTYLVNSQNYFITEPRYGRDYALRKTVYTEGVMQGLRGASGTSVYLGYHDKVVLGTSRYLPELRTICVTEIDQERYLQPIVELKRAITSIGAAVAFCVALIGWLSGMVILTPLRKLVVAANKVEAGNLKFAETIAGRHEIAELSRAFAAMTERLRTTLVSKELLQVEIEERKAAEDRLQATLTMLHRSNKDLEQFAYVASHDLQEPLRMVSSYVQLLAERYHGQLDEKALKFIDYAVDGAKRMQQLIQDLLSFSRVNTRGAEFAAVDCNDALAMATHSLQTAIAESQAVITSETLPVVHGDGTQITQVLQNLIANAIKFCKQPSPQVHVSAEDLGGFWRLSVKDNGIGIEEEYRDKIFVIFQRLHTREEFPGTGIGLAICKRVVERHGGEIWFTSVLGQGTTFYCTFPKPVLPG